MRNKVAVCHDAVERGFLRVCPRLSEVLGPRRLKRMEQSVQLFLIQIANSFEA